MQSTSSTTQTTVASFSTNNAASLATPPPPPLSLTTTSTTTTHLSAPSEVSQNTAISDRPKVKPVSKKDGKNLRKSANVLQQQNQMVILFLITTL